MTTLTEFLLARIAEERAAERDRHVFRDIPESEWDSLRPSWSKTLAYQGADLNAAFAQAGWSIVATVWPRLARARAADFADHPDYREEWKP